MADSKTPRRARKPKVYPTELPKDGLVRAWVVLHFYPVSDEHLRKQILAGKFPAPIKIGKRAVAWRASDVRAFLDGFKGTD